MNIYFYYFLDNDGSISHWCCNEHEGHITINNIFHVNIETAYDLLFGFKDFYHEFIKKKRILSNRETYFIFSYQLFILIALLDLKVDDWNEIVLNDVPYKIRKFYYTTIMGGFISGTKCHNEITRVILVFFLLIKILIFVLIQNLKKVIKYTPNKLHVIEDDTISTGIPYSNCFNSRIKWCLSRVTDSSCKLLGFTLIF